MNTKSVRKIKIAAVQMVSKVGEIEDNLAHAYTLLKVAVAREAQLVIFPELMPSGYTLAAKIWQGAEPANGPTVSWLCEVAKQYGVYVGTSFIETVGSHFYNTFVLADPDGKTAGRVRKEHVEVYFFKKGKNVGRVIETDLGKIGVGICADNHYANLLPEMQRERIDLMLMPHAWPSPREEGGQISKEDIERQDDMARKIAGVYQQYLGVPVMFVNRVGPAALDKGPGIISKYMNSSAYHFAGLSTIIDSNGEVKAQLGSREDVAVAEVILDPALKTNTPSPAFGKWLFPGSFVTREIIFGVDGLAGNLWYALNPKRRRIARRIALG